jgi:hypothetical protein
MSTFEVITQQRVGLGTYPVLGLACEVFQIGPPAPGGGRSEGARLSVCTLSPSFKRVCFLSKQNLSSVLWPVGLGRAWVVLGPQCAESHLGRPGPTVDSVEASPCWARPGTRRLDPVTSRMAGEALSLPWALLISGEWR